MSDLPPIRPDWLRHIRRTGPLFTAAGPVRERQPMGPNHRLRRDRALDASLALLADPYRYVARRCDALDTDLFETRLLLRPIVGMRGADPARLFYDP